jgi:hypothetical protein
MRRSTVIAAVAAALAVLTMAVLALPAIAAAADPPGSYEGTYTGVASGRDAKGKKGSSGVTVWVQVSGDQTTFTFRFDKLPVVVSQAGTSQTGANGKTVVPLSINKSGIRGRGTMTFSVSKQRWLLYGTGSGKARQYKGNGKLVCWRVSTGVALPSIGQQFKDLFSALAGGKPSTSAEMNAAAVGGSSGAGTSPSPEASVQPSAEALSLAPPVAAATAGPDAAVAASSAIDLAAQEPPVDDMKKLSALGLLLLIVTMSLALGLSTPKEAALEANEWAIDGVAKAREPAVPPAEPDVPDDVPDDAPADDPADDPSGEE